MCSIQHLQQALCQLRAHLVILALDGRFSFVANPITYLARLKRDSLPFLLEVRLALGRNLVAF